MGNKQNARINESLAMSHEESSSAHSEEHVFDAISTFEDSEQEASGHSRQPQQVHFNKESSISNEGSYDFNEEGSLYNSREENSLSFSHPLEANDINTQGTYVTDSSNESDFGTLKPMSVEDGCLFIIIYIITGIVVYTFLFDEFDVLESLYFSIITISTIGYGDYSPTSQGARLFTFFYILIGIALLGSALEAIFFSISNNLNDVGDQTSALILKAGESKMVQRISRMGSSFLRARDEIPNKVTSPHEEIQNHIHKYTSLSAFLLKNRYAFGFLLATLLYQGVSTEGSFIDGMYFWAVSTSTVGYGDIVPNSQAERMITMIISPLNSLLFAALVGNYIYFKIEGMTLQKQMLLFSRGLTEKDIQRMDKDKDNQVSEMEYVEAMLLMMNKVDNELLDHLHLQFKMMDNDKSGSLDKTELLQRMKRSFQFLDNTVSNQSQEQRPTHSRKSTISQNESGSDTLLEPLLLSHEEGHNDFII